MYNDDGLCTTWANYWVRNPRTDAYADLGGYAEKCIAAGKAVGTSHLEVDFDAHQCLDKCPNDRQTCFIGELADRDGD